VVRPRIDVEAFFLIAMDRVAPWLSRRNACCRKIRTAFFNLLIAVLVRDGYESEAISQSISLPRYDEASVDFA
jgi:hypothetical protein